MAAPQDDDKEGFKTRSLRRFAQVSSTTWYILQISFLILSFGAGAVTGSLASYVNLRTDTEGLRARVMILEDRIIGINLALVNLRKDDQELFIDLRAETAKIRDLLNELLLRSSPPTVGGRR